MEMESKERGIFAMPKMQYRERYKRGVQLCQNCRQFSMISRFCMICGLEI